MENSAVTWRDVRMERFVCIHGHFYQPPRENPWLGSIEPQDSAAPYPNWNERITAECYGPNAANYSKISFNFGPTLLTWMKDNAPQVYQSILDADRESRSRFSGHGSALAQAYNHMIMPLANRRDKETQILWGLRDFESRFGRFPEGMWLPETAVDLETLDLLAEHGIRFTILAPHQVRRIRKGDDAWEDVSGGKVDPKIAYQVTCPSGRRIAVFFYDGPISRAVAFENLLQSGEVFGSRLEGAFEEGRDSPQLVHIATDGETYGHHHRFGDMALAYVLQHLDAEDGVRLTNYGEFLERFPPTFEAEIFENTSWSCSHGVERWRSDCGCSGNHEGWNQAWRIPLRESLDWLRDRLVPVFEERGSAFFKDPWEARNLYIDIILSNHDRSKAGLSPTALKWMELQRHAQLMYTSCGWFFDDLSGIETVQVLRYAARVLQLARELFPEGGHLEPGFLKRLAKAVSNVPAQGDGARIFNELVRPVSLRIRS